MWFLLARQSPVLRRQLFVDVATPTVLLARKQFHGARLGHSLAIRLLLLALLVLAQSLLHHPAKKVKKKGKGTYSSFWIDPWQSYGASPGIWDHTVLPATRHRWARPALTPAMQAGSFILEFPSINSPILVVTHSQVMDIMNINDVYAAKLSSAHSAAAMGLTLIFMISMACIID